MYSNVKEWIFELLRLRYVIIISTKSGKKYIRIARRASVCDTHYRRFFFKGRKVIAYKRYSGPLLINGSHYVWKFP